MVKLSARLALAASLAGSGGSVVDVGTDHGYLPVYFAERGLFERIAASDIGEGPLQSAVSSAREHGVEGRIEFYLSDGLKDVPGRFDTVVIAGMGGETMVDIISSCPWIGGARLVLQPQSKVEELTEYLGRAGFVCDGAGLCRDAGRLYVAFSAVSGEGGFDLAETLMSRRDGLLAECVRREKERVQRALSGMESGASPEANCMDILKNRLSRLEDILKEAEKWRE